MIHEKKSFKILAIILLIFILPMLVTIIDQILVTLEDMEYINLSLHINTGFIQIMKKF